MVIIRYLYTWRGHGKIYGDEITELMVLPEYGIIKHVESNPCKSFYEFLLESIKKLYQESVGVLSFSSPFSFSLST